MRAAAIGAAAAAVAFALLHGAPPARWPRPISTPRPMRGRALPWWAFPATCTVGLLALAPPMAALPLLIVLGRPRWRARRLRQTYARQVRAALPEALDLLLLATGAGLSLPVAHPLVAPHCPEPVRAALVQAAERSERGEPRADALVAALRPLGERSLALAQVLVDHLRYGVPLIPGLERLRLELRLDRRRHAEQAARRVPVRLLGPLVACVLPAFVLLTVVPLLAASLQSLPT